MPIPVISTTTSILGYRKGQHFSYQMAAANTPTSWAALGLPAGLTIDSAGLITGEATYPGVYLVTVTATNASGPSTPLSVAMGIEDTAFSDGVGIEVDIDLRTGKVSLLGVTAKEGDPILALKRGDQVFLDIGFFKATILQELVIEQIRLNLKEYESEQSLVLSSGAVIVLGSGDTSRYRILVELDGDALSNVLANYEGDKRTVLPGIAEIEWSITWMDGATARTATRTSQTFSMSIDRDLIPQAP